MVGLLLVSAGATFLLRNDPASQPTVTAQRVPTEPGLPTSPPDTSAAAQSVPTAVPSLAAAAQPSPAPPLNDVGWLLVAFQGFPDFELRQQGMGERIRLAHERLSESKDDPAWARPTELALREYLRTLPQENFEVMSVACRSDGCEVQAVKLGSPDALRALTLPGGLTIEANPLPSLSMEISERGMLGDRAGVYWSFRRVGNDASTAP